MDRSLAAVRRLLLTRDLDAVAQGIELAVSLADPAAFDELLVDVRYDPDAVFDANLKFDPRISRYDQGNKLKGTGRVVSEKAFKGNGRDQPYLEQAMLGLVARGLGDRAASLRAAITRLTYGSDEDDAPPVRLSFLAGLPALRALAIHVRAGIQDIGALGTLPALVEADLRTEGPITHFEGIAAAPALESLRMRGRVDDLTPMAGCRARHVLLSDRHCVDVRGLGGMPHLEELELWIGGSYEGLSNASIRKLKSMGTGELPGIGEMPHLERLECSSPDGLTAAPRLQELVCYEPHGMPPLPALRRIRVAEASKLLPHIGRLPQLQEITAKLDIAHWRDLGPLPTVRLTFGRVEKTVTTDAPPHVTPVWEGGGYRGPALELPESVESLVGLGHAEGIEILSLRGCRKLRTLDGLQGLASLRVLDLRGCHGLTDASALQGLDPRAIIGFDCPFVVEGGLPDDQQGALVLAQDPNLVKLAKRPRPAPAKRAKAAPVALADAAWDAIVAAIDEHSHAGADRAAELARESGLPAYERLLRGGAWSEADGKLRASGVALDGGTALKQHLLRRLFAEAPDTCAVAARTRARVTHLVVPATVRQDWWWKVDNRVDLAPLAGFPELRRLVVEAAGPLVNGEGLSRCRRLEAVELRDYAEQRPPGTWFSNLPLRSFSGRVTDLTGLPRSLESFTATDTIDPSPLRGYPSLHEIKGVTLRESDLSGFPALRTLHCTQGIVDALRSDTLEELDVWLGTEIGDLSRLSALRSLRIATPWSGGRRAPLTRLGPLPPSLTRLHLADGACERAIGLEACTGLRVLHFEMLGSETDLSWLAKAPNLKRAEIEEWKGLDPLRALPIEELEIRLLYPWDIPALERHPTLRTVHTPNVAVLPERLRP